MEYGHFDDAVREYVITNPRTPIKWINYIGTLAFGGFVDQTGGALICKQDPTFNRITKYISQMPSSDFKGETLYLRITTLTPTLPPQGGREIPSPQPALLRGREIPSPQPAPVRGREKGDGARIFSPYFVPTLDAYDRYECHVGLGYTRIVSEFYGIRCEVSIFVPLGENRVLRDIRVTNLSGEAVEVDVIPVVEYTHPDALKQLTNADWVPQTMQSKALKEESGHVVLAQFPFMNRNVCVNYFTSNHPVSSFESDRKIFLGDNEYGTWADPLSLHEPELNNTEAQRGDNIAALLHRLGRVQPGETRRIITQLGQGESLAAELPRIRKYRDEANVDRAFEGLENYGDAYLRKLQVETPDANMDRMLNIHNPRQCQTTANWSRYLSLYQLGYGSRGIGFRDSSQDVLGVVASMPEQARTLLRQLLSVQKPDGSAMHQFNPLTMAASEGDSLERPDLPHYYSDDHLWIILAVCAYLKETGDMAFLDEHIPFYGSRERDRVMEHLERAIEFTRRDVGAHGLPLLGFADWNDTINLRAGAESLLTANLYGKALWEMIDLARFCGDLKVTQTYSAYYDEMKRRVNDCGWDGEWYVSYFDADGTPLGSQENDYGQIYITGQVWPVISGFATPARARQALDSMYAKLNTANGIKLSVPAFNGFDPRRGGITTYPPGAKENGGIFLHTNPWAIIAETLAGNGDRATEYYRQTNPAAKNDRIDEFECEPYVYPQNILGDEHPQFGLARNSWLSGTAAWMYVAATQYILGIQPTYEGLRLAPCIPARWDGFRMTREFRGAVYEIAVKRDKGVWESGSKDKAKIERQTLVPTAGAGDVKVGGGGPQRAYAGIQRIEVDGRRIEGNVIPIFEGGVHHVGAVLAEGSNG